MKKTQTTKPLYPETLWDRPLHYYPKSGGKILVLAGSQKNASALSFCVEALYDSGSANIIAGFPDQLLPIYSGLLPPEILLPLKSTYGGSLSEKAYPQIKERLEGTKTCLIGPGLSTNSETQALVIKILKEYQGNKIIVSEAILALLSVARILSEKGGKDAIFDYFRKQSGTNICIFTESDYEKTCKILLLDSKPILESLNTIANLMNSYVVLYSGEIAALDPTGETVVTKNVANPSNEKNPLFAFASIITSAVSHGEGKILEKIATSSFIMKTIFQEMAQKNVDGISFLKYIQPVTKKLEEEYH